MAPGDAAPDFDLAVGPAARVRLSDFAGGKLVLFFYPTDDSPTCTTEALAFSALAPKFKAASVEVLGVSPDSLASHEKFKKKRKLDVTLAADESHAALEAYDVWREKQMFGRKFMGVERTTVLIDAKGRIARLWRKVRTSGHAETVLEAARALKG
ncbi:MAG TPA: peroxiredoxin [Roseiarcus sp.]|nr:peroxiredoxin [Roseiarcus sp.]